MSILVTGGLGYIGSHICSLIKNPIIIDNKSNSDLNFKKKFPNSKVYLANITKNNLKKVFSENKITSIIHLAAFKSVEESLNKPLKYYNNNVSTLIHLIETMEEFKINKLIFSSSATVYGNKNKNPIKERNELSSNNPYGNSKIICENIISEYCKSNKKFKAVSLRYFNPIGASVKHDLKEKPLGIPQNLMPKIIESIIKNKKLKIYGKNYKTYDGTCIRDFIHVLDLAEAHISSIKFLNKNKINHEIFNVGLGKGISVLELIKIFEKTNKIKIKYIFSKARNGDVPEIYACNKKIKAKMKWRPKYDYNDMVRDAWLSSKK